MNKRIPLYMVFLCLFFLLNCKSRNSDTSSKRDKTEFETTQGMNVSNSIMLGDSLHELYRTNGFEHLIKYVENSLKPGTIISFNDTNDEIIIYDRSIFFIDQNGNPTKPVLELENDINYNLKFNVYKNRTANKPYQVEIYWKKHK
jgi:hypothetical protein